MHLGVAFYSEELWYIVLQGGLSLYNLKSLIIEDCTEAASMWSTAAQVFNQSTILISCQRLVI